MDFKPEIKKYQNLVFENLDKCQDVDLLIIKGQIIIEHHLNRFILSSIKSPTEFDDTKFTFSQKVQLSLMFGLLTDLKEELILINKLRNQIAHKLAYNEEHLNTLLIKISQHYPSIKRYNNNFLALKTGIAFICGALYAAVAVNRLEFINILDKELDDITDKESTD